MNFKFSKHIKAEYKSNVKRTNVTTETVIGPYEDLFDLVEQPFYLLRRHMIE